MSTKEAGELLTSAGKIVACSLAVQSTKAHSYSQMINYALSMAQIIKFFPWREQSIL